jgi:isopentenyl phosphate kinase
MEMKKPTLLKLGGSLITDKSSPFTARDETIRRLCREIKEALDEKPVPLVVGHGGGSFPHQSAAKYQTHKGEIDEKSWEGICVVQNDAAKLNRIIVDALLEADVKAMSVQPSASFVTERVRIKEYYTKPIEFLLEKGIIPVPYGDVGLDLKQGMCIVSTEEILFFLAQKLGAKRVIFCGKTDGVFTADPGKDEKAKLIKEITRKNFGKVKGYLTDSDGTDVTGGMLHKVERALEIAGKGVTVEIINGEKAGVLKRALLGEEGIGTVIR